MKRHKLAEAFFTVGQQLLLRHMFGQFRFQAAPCLEGPIVIIANHSSFYDSLVVFELYRRQHLPQNMVAIMNNKGRNTIPLFKQLGTIPVSTPMKLSEYKKIRHVMQTHPLLIFPQGKEMHLEQRPLNLQDGTEKLLQKYPQHHLLFLSIYYSIGQIRGEITCRLDYLDARDRPKSITTEKLEQMMTEQLQQVKEHVLAQRYEGYEQLW